MGDHARITLPIIQCRRSLPARHEAQERSILAVFLSRIMDRAQELRRKKAPNQTVVNPCPESRTSPVRRSHPRARLLRPSKKKENQHSSAIFPTNPSRIPKAAPRHDGLRNNHSAPASSTGGTSRRVEQERYARLIYGGVIGSIDGSSLAYQFARRMRRRRGYDSYDSGPPPNSPVDNTTINMRRLLRCGVGPDSATTADSAQAYPTQSVSDPFS